MTGPVAGGAAEFEAKLAAFVKDKRLYGAAAGVVHGDELAWSGGAGFADVATGRPAAADTLFRIASITKTFTGTAIMQLRDGGKLDLDDPAVQWLPELTASGTPQAIGRITIRQLLSHESGLMSEPPDTDWTLLSPAYQAVAAENIARAAEIIAVIGPNMQTKYCNLGYQLLGEIVHRAGGTPYPAYVRREILDPLGLSDTAFEPLGDALAARCATGYSARAFSDELEVAPRVDAWAEGGLWSSVEDLGRWLSFQLRAHGGQPDDSPVLAAESRREMHKPRYLTDETWTQAWGISWYATRKDGVTWVQHSGGLHGFTSNACFDTEHKVGAMVLLNGEADAPALAMELAGIGRNLVRASAPAVALPQPTPEAYKPLLGLYCFPGSAELRQLEWRDGKLAVLNPADRAESIPLLPSGDPDTFVVGPGFRDSGETVRFTREPTGQVASVYVGSATLLRLEPVAPEHGTGAEA
jgi:CubicO group peptidase (beta-lactamase class C family)